MLQCSAWASQVALVVKNPHATAKDVRDVGSIPGSGKSPGGGLGNPWQCSCLENPMDRGAWCAVVHRVEASWTWLKWLSIWCSVKCMCVIHIPTTRPPAVLTAEMEWEGKGGLKSWDLYTTSCSLDSGLLVFKANKLYLKWKTTLLIFEYLWWRVALVGLLSQELSPPGP